MKEYEKKVIMYNLGKNEKIRTLKIEIHEVGKKMKRQ